MDVEIRWFSFVSTVLARCGPDLVCALCSDCGVTVKRIDTTTERGGGNPIHTCVRWKKKVPRGGEGRKKVYKSEKKMIKDSKM